jgi:hypothetical protein
LRSVFVNPPPPKPEVILTNFFAEPTVLLVPITSRAIRCGFVPGFKLWNVGSSERYILHIQVWCLTPLSAIFQLYHGNCSACADYQPCNTVWVRARLCKLQNKGALDSQPQVIKFTSYLPMVSGSLRLLPPLKLVATHTFRNG